VLGLAAAAFWTLRRAMVPAARPATWSCGYAAPAPRAQYSGSSFAQSLVSIFSWALWPRVRVERPAGYFPAGASLETGLPDVVLDRALLPAFTAVGGFFRWVRLLQQGKIQVYILYVLLTVVVLFVSVFVV
jgi:hypothetical protein